MGKDSFKVIQRKSKDEEFNNGRKKNRTKESARFSCSLEFLYCLTKFVKPQRGGINKRESTSEIATVLDRWEVVVV